MMRTDAGQPRQSVAGPKPATDSEETRLAVSLATLAQLLDAHRSSVRRWLAAAGARPLTLGRGRHAAIRYLWTDVEAWLRSREHVD